MGDNTAAGNVAVGSHALSDATTGANNVAVGYWALGDGPLGYGVNVAVGSHAGFNHEAQEAVFVG